MVEKERRWQQHRLSTVHQAQPRTTNRSPGRERAVILKQPSNNLFSTDSALNKCLTQYALALVNPFDENARGACVPTFPSMPSMKSYSFQRLDTVIGLNGYAYVVARPDAANNIQCAAYTNSTYPGTAVTSFSATNSATIDVFTHNGPFDNLDFAPNLVQWRLVGLGLRVRYSGTELNRSGRISTLEHPNHQDFVGFTPNDVMGFDNAVPVDFDRRWHCCTYQPIFPVEMNYSVGTAIAGTSAGNYFLAITLNGVAGQSISIEYVQHAEYIGSPARGKTPNTSDPSLTQQIASKIGSVASHVLSTAADQMTKHPAQTVHILRNLLAFHHGPSQRVIANMAHNEL